MLISNSFNLVRVIQTPFGERSERFDDVDIGSMSSGSSESLVNVSDVLVTCLVGVTGFWYLLEIDFFRGVVGALATDVPDEGS